MTEPIAQGRIPSTPESRGIPIVTGRGAPPRRLVRRLDQPAPGASRSRMTWH